MATSDAGVHLDALDSAESAAVAHAVPARRAEFATGRACAHSALDALGIARSPILVGQHREPLWPVGIVGSITHAGTMCAAAVARTTDVSVLGIDLEIDAPLPDGDDRMILTDGERAHIRDLAPDAAWDTVIFSAKESVYKGWFPIEHRWLGFEDVEVRFDGAGAFAATFTSVGPTVHGITVPSFAGRFDVIDGVIMTAVCVPATG